MQLKFVKFLLVGSFIYWSTGLAQDLHERFEHHHDNVASLVPPGPGNNEYQKPLQEGDDHDDCLICKTLKDMRVEKIVPPAFPRPPMDWVQILPIIHRQAPVVCFVVFIPARAPPAFAISKSA